MDAWKYNLLFSCISEHFERPARAVGRVYISTHLPVLYLNVLEIALVGCYLTDCVSYLMFAHRFALSEVAM